MRMLLLDLDSLSPDHLGCYGYHRNTSPNIDRIAQQAVRFENYYTSDAPCSPSRAALMSGRFGINNGIVGHGGTAGDMRHEGASRGFRDALARESLPALLRAAGLKTVLFSPFGERHSQWTFYAGFSEMHNTGNGGMESAEEVTPHVLDWIERNAAQDDWFLYVNYWDPHTPYRAPEEFGNPFAEEPLPEWITEEVLERHKQKVGPHSARDINMYDNRTNPQYPRHPGEILDMDGMRRMIDGYDCGIRYMDEHIGRLFEAFQRQGVMDDLVIVITADHGENMGQLGIYGEHGTADQGTCHIPMIVRWPGVTRPHVDKGLHYHLDLAPTLAELLQQDASPRWDGQSYAAALTEGADCGRDYVVVSQCAHVCQRSVRFGDWMYMRTYHDGYHMFPKEMLFNLKDDPFEQNDVAAANFGVCKDGVYYLNEWHDARMNAMPYATDPLWTVMKEGGPFHAKGHLQAYAERLEQSERGGAVEELKRRHPGEFAK
ncbi:sulfatase [Paenibacillus thalictri]|uniref:Sulfatase n=1 Tax=Paenibacillus thalictri TaxID=2527873 RepID=A0A4Q9DL22_9BACL|nr:sulfatase [Paenibacillus thalictri]TBL72487.1 sulfatase [Paenibacillus thalictri]